ncbi:MAG: iron-containing redox enzyme family protein [Kofleriaceae bacterium]
MSARLHLQLAHLDRMRLAPGAPKADWRSDLEEELALRAIELAWIEEERAQIAPIADRAPRDAARFVRWFEDLERDGPGQHDPLYGWLAEAATLGQMRWFLRQELASAVSFEDLVAITQVRLPAGPKLGLARDFWCELGRGHEALTRGPMLTRLADELSLAQLPDDILWEARAVGNMLCGLAANRCYTYQAIGALGVVRLIAGFRAAHIRTGLERLGVSAKAIHYYDIDSERSPAWNRDVVGPLVAGNVELAPLLAEGALLWLEIGARCSARYRDELSYVHSRAA